MTGLKIVFLVLGAAFALFGYLIFFRKKYFLINGFEQDRKAGRKTDAYADGVGFSELVFGVVLLIAGIVLVIVKR